MTGRSPYLKLVQKDWKMFVVNAQLITMATIWMTENLFSEGTNQVAPHSLVLGEC